MAHRCRRGMGNPCRTWFGQLYRDFPNFDKSVAALALDKLGGLPHQKMRESGIPKRVIAVARFTNQSLSGQLQAQGIETIQADLLEPGVLPLLPDVPNVIFMAARKFGTSGSESLTWALNTYLPGLVAERYKASRIVAFSTGNVYPLVPINHGGATEQTPVWPMGEYAQSALGRERMFEYASHCWRTAVTIDRHAEIWLLAGYPFHDPCFLPTNSTTPRSRTGRSW